MKKYTLLFILIFFCTAITTAQKVNKEDSIQIRNIYDMAFLNGKSYDWLDYLSNEIGGRLSGLVQADSTVRYPESEAKALGLGKGWL